MFETSGCGSGPRESSDPTMATLHRVSADVIGGHEIDTASLPDHCAWSVTSRSERSLISAITLYRAVSPT
jgi:hypothetical protein